MVTSLGHIARVACMTLLLRQNLPMLNMAESESNVEQRYAIKFMFKEGESASNVYIRLQKVYGEHCMSRARVLKWFQRFITGRTSIDKHSGMLQVCCSLTISQMDRQLMPIDISQRLKVEAQHSKEETRFT